MDPNTLRLFMGASSDTEPEIGDEYGGGFFAGYISQNADGVATHRLIVAPKSSGESSTTLKMHNTNGSPSVTTTLYDGATNTSNWNTNVNSPACSFASGLSINGYTDWYIPARYEMQVIYYHLKPGNTSNVTNRGSNAYAVPTLLTSNIGYTLDYSTTEPPRTSVTDFRSGGAEAFAPEEYWCSSIGGGGRPHKHDFADGNVTQDYANVARYVRAIRKVAI